MKKHATSLLIILFPLLLFSQKEQIDCANIFNEIEALLTQKDTTEALRLFSSLENRDCVIRKGQYRYISRVSFLFGKIEESKTRMLQAVELGILGLSKFHTTTQPTEQEIREKYGTAYINQLKHLSDSILEQRIITHGELIYALRSIYEADQALRRDSITKSCRKYASSQRFQPDTHEIAQDHAQQIMCFNAFYHLDSIILQEFVNIVKKIGYVPGDDQLFGTVEVVPIILHTAHYQFSELDSIYIKSIEKGTISPALYAAYKGYQSEWFQQESSLLFTTYNQVSSDLTEVDIQQINDKRIKLGIPILPATLWNTKLF
ncbi:hypothetical protein [Lewinella cohaerens]|uniref:hypothetical protein n=1 Tax=Lewinella cohaerens TaxID=70995 RepID=UPI00036A757B|nr:hypothetical protein [Lewinella cohaerens]